MVSYGKHKLYNKQEKRLVKHLSRDVYLHRTTKHNSSQLYQSFYVRRV